MSVLSDKIRQDLTEALKQRDQVRVSTLRFLISHLENARISKGADLEDGEVLDQIAKDAKRHKESIEAFGKAGRSELVATETAQLKVLEEYLPKQLSGVEIGKIVDEVISELSPSGMADTGKVIGSVMSRVKGQADGVQVSAIVKEKLMAK